MTKLDRKEFDLHTHTTASDGLLAPAEIVALAAERGLAGLAITDHDTVSGAEEAISAGRAIGVDVIPGVEISTSGNGEDIHVLGLWIDPKDERFRTRLATNRDVRRKRNTGMIEALRSHGFDVTLEEAEEIASRRRAGEDRSVSRPHIAELLVHKGYVESVAEAFGVWLGNGCKAFVAAQRITPQEAVQWIHEAGGVAVLAHPGLYREDAEWIEKLAGSGLAGIEAAHADHGVRQERHYSAYAERLGLIATAGSDFHGIRDGVPFHAMLGSRTVGMDIVERLRRKLKGKREY
jgi:predicted metal-dependent phosphoesterase TrpH